MAKVIDFPMIFAFCVPSRKSGWQGRFPVWSFRTYPFPGNRRNTFLISAFFAKSTAARVGLSV
jgi:hypothetical protein